MLEQLIAEATECDFKVALETKKPKGVSAFSNGIGGTLFLGFQTITKLLVYLIFKKILK